MANLQSTSASRHQFGQEHPQDHEAMRILVAAAKGHGGAQEQVAALPAFSPIAWHALLENLPGRWLPLSRTVATPTAAMETEERPSAHFTWWLVSCRSRLCGGITPTSSSGTEQRFASSRIRLHGGKLLGGFFFLLNFFFQGRKDHPAISRKPLLPDSSPTSPCLGASLPTGAESRQDLV